MLAENKEISGEGGVLVLGQEQDSPGGHFSAAESFRGQLTRFNIWSRFLNKSEVNKVMNSCLEQIGDVVAWSDFYPGIHGFVQVRPVLIKVDWKNFSIYLLVLWLQSEISN